MDDGTPDSTGSAPGATDELLNVLLNSSFEGIAISIDGVIVETNQAFAHMSGYSRAELVGMTVADLATPESCALVLERIRNGWETPYEVVGVRRDGSTLPCEVLARNIQYQNQAARLTAFRDIRERQRAQLGQKRLEERMLAAQKLEKLGMLAGGVAHDFNNLLLVILGHTELALRWPPAAKLHEHLQQIHAATQRAGELTKQLLTYAGCNTPSTAAVDLSGLLCEVGELLAVSIPKQIVIERALSKPLPMIEADPVALRQVALNLIANAADALGTNAGSIRLHTARVHVNAAQLREAYVDATQGPGEFVLLEVQDSGCGMAAATLERIFDPFYSTKLTGRGLGLAVVIGIVRSHHAALFVASEPGVGSRFSLLFAAAEPSEPEPWQLPAATRQVLLVAQDDAARSRCVTMLEALSFRVRTAADGGEAQRVLQARPEVGWLMIDSAEQARSLAAIGPQAQVLPMLVLEQSRLAGPSSACLAKPFHIQTLAVAIRRLLELPPSAAGSRLQPIDDKPPSTASD